PSRTTLAGAASTAASVFLLGTLFAHTSTFLSSDSRVELCGDASWAWSLSSDCFREGFLWPALLLLTSGLTASAFGLCLALPAKPSSEFETDGSAPLARMAVGAKKTPVRRPPGSVILVDNRSRVGFAVLAALAMQTALYAVWWHYASATDSRNASGSLYPAALTGSAAMVLLASAAFLAALGRSNPMVYAGLFPWVLPALVGVQLLLGAVEIYASFFTDKNIDVPIIGSHASVRSNFLLATTVSSFVVLVIFSNVQQRPVFLRPIKSTEDSSPTTSSSAYEPLNGCSKDMEDTDTTPLARPDQLKARDLADTAEFNVSWFDRLTFAWASDLLRRGAARQMKATDMYKLDKADMPVRNWRRYLRHRKPGRSLFTTMSITFAAEIVVQVVLALINCILHFSGPFFLQRILREIQHSDDDSSTDELSFRKSYLYAFGLLICTLASSLLGNQALWIGRHIGARIKGILVAEISLKTLRRRGKGSWDGKQGKDNEERESEDADFSSAASNGKIMSLIGGELNRIYDVASYLDQLFSTPLSLAIGIWYMYQMLGVSALVGLSFGAVYTSLLKRMFSRTAVLDKNLRAIGDKRITMITELVQGIRVVKLSGWESRFLAIINKLRESQVDYVWNSLVYGIRINLVSGLGPMVVLITIFTVYVGILDNKLTAEIAFTSVSVFHIVRGAFDHLPGFLNWATSAYVALERIGSYLEQSQVQDLEERVSAAQDISNSQFNDMLGFSSADLQWGIPASTGNGSTIGPNEMQTSEGSNCNGSESGTQSDEDTPLLVSDSSLLPHLGPSANSLTTLAGKQNDIVRFSLKNIDVQFPIGGFTIVGGPTGCGKSSLLSAMVGEMSLTRGHIMLPTADFRDIAARDSKYREIIELSGEERAIYDIAYVAQEAWLRNTTIRENILFGEPYDGERYEEVLRACALKPDLRILPAGDTTEIGERGITLSGGQKQRVALARAVYSNRRILLIDDCLSAVDSHTGKHILMECLLSKTKLMQGRTRILVTHHIAMCLPYAQYMVMMHEGRITLKGSPAELQNQSALSKALAELDRKDSTADKKEASEKDRKGKSIEDAFGKEDGASGEMSLTNPVNDMKTETEYNAERQRMIEEQQSQDPTGDTSTLRGTLVKEEKREEGFVKFKVWKMYLSACGATKFWGLTLFFIIISQCIGILQDYWIRIWVRSAGDGGPARVTLMNHSATFWLGIYALIGLVGIIWRTAQGFVVYTGWSKASKNIHAKLMYTIVRATPRFFETTPVGRIIARFSRDIGVIDGETLNTFLGWVSDIFAVLGVFIIISVVTPAFLSVAAVVFLLYAGISFYYLNSSREIKRIELNSLAPLMSLVSELLEGISTIRAFGMKQCYLKEVINIVEIQNGPYYMFWATNRWLQVRTDFAGALVSFSCALFIVSNLDRMDAGLAGFVLSYALSFSERMVWVIHNYGANELNMNATERIMQYLDIDQEAPLHSDPENKPSALWPRKGDLQIENLVAEYVPGVPVLNNISLSVKHGEKIGIVGRTGAGKSSMSLALLRYLEASKGRIVLDGIDISKIGLEDLRRNVTIIPQDPVLFNGTIRFNLDPFDEHPDELLWDSLKRTHLVNERESQTNSSTASVSEGVNENAPSLERMAGIFTSLDAEIKENGQNLSQGQRQLVSLARALVRRSKLIIMDEATASVDFDTDERIQRTIRGPEFANSTLFCVAHRLRTIIDYDKVLVLDRGKVAEFDTPHNLLQIENGIFRSMCKKTGEFEHLVAAAATNS
ncbi:hypothetical protein LPJ59_003251, partial [Coemansia sp. RSA 2399]